ncbi:MAG: VOC family protein, partial [Candidatus Limnocylindrales bacterium]
QEAPTMTEPRVIHFEIAGRDAKALQQFWGSLLGWSLDTSNPGGYGMTNPDQTGIVVGIGGTPDGSAGHVTGYVRVDDIDATLARAVELGGAVIMPKFSPGPNATLALVADAEGHVVGLTE